MDELKTLIASCRCGVYLTVNEHRNYCMTPEKRLEDFSELQCPPDISADVRDGILRTGNIVELHVYPDTPIGSYHIVHYDLDDAVREAIECVGSRKRL